MVRRILVPLDGSPLAESALPHAAAIAQAFQSEILLLRVLSSERRAGQQPVDSADWRLRRTEAASYLESLVSWLEERGGTATAELAEGNTEEEILAVARGHAADLVVMTTHGRSGVNEFNLGGTAAKVLSRAGLSVMVVRAPASPVPGPVELDWRYRRVLVAVDGSQRADWALHLAASLARANGSELVLAHVVPVPEMHQRWPGSPREARLAERVVQVNRVAAKEYLEEMKSKLSTAGSEVRTVLVVSPQVAQALHELAEREEADLLVLSAHGTSGAAPWPYGSVSGALLAYGTVPLLIFQDLPSAIREEHRPRAGLTAHTGNGWPR